MRLVFLRAIFYFVIVSLVLACDLALAEQDPIVTRAKELMDEAEYAEAQRVLSRGLARGKLSPPTKMQLYWMQGICLVSLENQTSARTSFLKLLALDPFFEPDALTAPKISSAFNEAKAVFAKAGGLDGVYKPRLVPIDDQTSAQNVPVYFSIGNLSRLGDVGSVVMYLRQLGTSNYTSIDLVKDAEVRGRFVGTIPANLVVPREDTYALEYYVEALSSSQARLSGVGTHKLPLSFLVGSHEKAQGKDSIAEKSTHSTIWPYLVGIGAFALSGLVFGLVSLTGPQDTSLRVVVHQAY
jgi:hypothetical protein